MRLRIEHRTAYRYDQQINYAIQSMRVMPRRFNGLNIESWSVSVTGRRQPLVSYLDGYGNWVHLHTLNAPHDSTEIVVSGLVNVTDCQGVVAGAEEPLPPFFFLRETDLTEPNEDLEALAHAVPEGGDMIERLHRLMALIRDRIDYQGGETDSFSSAADALKSGLGVCQDHAHVMIACARVLGIPARYISGYLNTGDSRQDDASHAWVEAFVPDLGWVGFDPSNRVCPTENYVRVAVGLDYWSAAPVRGLWRGQAEESLSVSVQVAMADSTQ